eukprot:GHVN01032074.1.p1 GENE.GHVN01032074.1~~GHVN01032074.1.p1  ORF type:complete len:260 (+),score=23.97 GHVN01032074.1:94-873(+)
MTSKSNKVSHVLQCETCKVKHFTGNAYKYDCGKCRKVECRECAGYKSLSLTDAKEAQQNYLCNNCASFGPSVGSINIDPIIAVIRNELRSGMAEYQREFASQKKETDRKFNSIDIRFDALEKKTERLGLSLNDTRKISATQCIDSSNEVADILARRRNLILTGVPVESELDPLVPNIFALLKCDVTIIRMWRLRTKKPNSISVPVKIVCRNDLQAQDVLAAAAQLKNHPDYDGLYLSPDRTPHQQQQYNALQPERKKET